MSGADSIAYTFGRTGGLITYTVRASDRADTRTDNLTVGFSTNRPDSIIVYIGSATSNDFLQLQLVISLFNKSSR